MIQVPNLFGGSTPLGQALLRLYSTCCIEYERHQATADRCGCEMCVALRDIKQAMTDEMELLSVSLRTGMTTIHPRTGEE